MKLSHTMLSFLGYLAERPASGWCDKHEPEAFLSHFGAVAAFKNGLLREGTLELKGVEDPAANAMGLGLPASYPGYVLTELGWKLGKVGARMRADDDARRDSPQAAAYIAEGQQVLNDACDEE